MTEQSLYYPNVLAMSSFTLQTSGTNVIGVEKFTMKVVGRRVRERVSPAEALDWQTKASTMLHRGPICDKGVFRFKTFEEAQEWMLEQMTRRAREARRKRTSSRSPAASTSREPDMP